MCTGTATVAAAPGAVGILHVSARLIPMCAIGVAVYMPVHVANADAYMYVHLACSRTVSNPLATTFI